MPIHRCGSDKDFPLRNSASCIHPRNGCLLVTMVNVANNDDGVLPEGAMRSAPLAVIKGLGLSCNLDGVYGLQLNKTAGFFFFSFFGSLPAFPFL